MRVRTMLLTGGLMLVAASAQAQSVAGKWTANFPMRVRMENGEPSQAEQQGIALLELEQKGDSVFGTWTVQNTPAQVPPRQLRGTFVAGKLVFQAQVEGRVNMNGDERTVKMITTYEATLKGDALDGTMSSKSEDGSIESSPMPWSAKKST